MKNIKPTNKINYEIEKMAHMITKRYNVENPNSAKEIAQTLYENGIDFEKFSPKYFKGEFDLDEIVNYLIRKKEEDRKVIPIKTYLPSETSDFIYNNKTSELIPFPQNYSRAKGKHH